ncbi:MAG: hypothetical protein WDO14_05150 [Bacteroidota bacterium]
MISTKEKYIGLTCSPTDLIGVEKQLAGMYLITDDRDADKAHHMKHFPDPFS